MTLPDPHAAAAEAAAALLATLGIDRVDVAAVLGSGWAPAAQTLAGRGRVIGTAPMSSLPHFQPPTAAGHGGTVQAIEIDGTVVLLLLGRTHAYEGFDLSRVVHPIRTACAAGAGTVVLTNAAGGLRPEYTVGQPVLIADHLNLTARSPIVGAQFVDLVDAYDPALREAARRVDPTLAEGVYAGLPGPHYETPAEIRMLRVMGADLVGMSTVHETIAARAAGARVLGFSLVTNLAAGITGEPLNHEEVLAAGKAAAASMGTLLADVIGAL